MSERERLIGIVQRILDGDYSNDEEVDRLAAEFRAGVLDPEATGLLSWSSDYFDHEPTSAEIVDIALRYRPIEL